LGGAFVGGYLREYPQPAEVKNCTAGPKGGEFWGEELGVSIGTKRNKKEHNINKSHEKKNIDRERDTSPGQPFYSTYF